MADFSPIVCAEGLSLILPPNWEYEAEVNSLNETVEIRMNNMSCAATLELLENGATDPETFLSRNRLDLMQALASLGAKFADLDSRFPNEIRATRFGVDGEIVHIWKATNPVVHFSSIVKSEQDLNELRLIGESIQVDTNKVRSSRPVLRQDGYVAMKILGEWEEVSSPVK